MRFDVCNGDADGLCAALQWRLQHAGPVQLVTGLKRDIALLERAPARPGDEVNVFDLSMQRNLEALQHLLDSGVRVRYFDHHAVDVIPVHALLDAQIDGGRDVCTSLLVDRRLDGAHRAWALVGAYGDNLTDVADRLAVDSGIDVAGRDVLRHLGEAINYNAYGEDEADVCVAPAQLYAIMVQYRDPWDMRSHEGVFAEMDALRRSDLDRGRACPTHWQDAQASVRMLPNAPWSRRVIGCLGNELASADPQRAHAVLRPQSDGGYLVSVRAPEGSRLEAQAFCRRFGGGGRAGSAGIEGLPSADLSRFLSAFAAAPWTR